MTKYNYAMLDLARMQQLRDEQELCTLHVLSASTREIILSLLRYSEFVDTRWFAASDVNTLGHLTVDEREQAQQFSGLAFEEVILGCNVDDITTKLGDIATALTAGGGCGCGAGGAGQTDEPASETQPGYPFEQIGDPPPGFDTWADYNDWKCSIAEWIISNMEADIASFAAIDWETITSVTLAIAILTPVPFDDVIALLGLVLAIFLQGVLATALGVMADVLTNSREELLCALYWSEDVEDARSNFIDAIDTAVDSETSASWAGLAKTIFGLMASYANLNNLFDYDPVRAANLPPADCSDCGGCPTVANVPWGSVTQIETTGNHVIGGEYDSGNSHYWIVLHFGQETGGPSACGPGRDITINSYNGATMTDSSGAWREDESEFLGRAGIPGSWDLYNADLFLTGSWTDVRTLTIKSDTAFTMDIDIT